MIDGRERDILSRTIARARKKLFFQSLLSVAFRVGVAVLPLGALVIAVDQRWWGGQFTIFFGLITIATVVLSPVIASALRVATPLGAARAMDERAALKSRISSAWDFLAKGPLDEARLAQVKDAVKHAESLDISSAFRSRLPGLAYVAPVMALLFVLSFFVPPKIVENEVEAAVESRRALQVEELRGLEEDLAVIADEEEALRDVLEKLRMVEKRFEEGELTERDVMIELARLDEALRQKLDQLGAENLSTELNTIMPQLMASNASREVAKALKENDMDGAARKMEKMAEQVRKDRLSKEDKEQLAMNMGVAASKLGSKSQGSFGGDFGKASRALKSSDAEGFSKASKSMGNKFRSVKQYRALKKSKGLLKMAKTSLGLQPKLCSVCNGSGCSVCNGSGLSNSLGLGSGGGKGGLKAGTAPSGTPLGNASRLADSYREMVKVTGMAGDGPVESEVEATEGQTSASQIAIKDLYAEYSKVAEEAIDREEIPLSHRFHVKRYFQAIRPTDE